MSFKKFFMGIALMTLVLPMSATAISGNTNQTGQSDQSTRSVDNSQGQQSGDSSANTDTSTQSQTQSQTETQTQTNNPDTGTITQEQARTELQTELQKNEPTYTPEEQATQTRLNAVSQAVQAILIIASRVATQNKSLSDKIQVVAQVQIQTQDKANQALDKAENRSGFAKFFIGPNYKQLKTVKQEQEQNQLRIRELNQIMSQIANTSDQAELKNQIKILEAQNTALQEQLNQDVRGFSLFGWISKLVNQY